MSNSNKELSTIKDCSSINKSNIFNNSNELKVFPIHIHETLKRYMKKNKPIDIKVLNEQQKFHCLSSNQEYLIDLE